MKKQISAFVLALLCTSALLCGCTSTENENISGENSSEQSSESLVNSSEISSDNSTSDETGNKSVDIGNGMKLTGTLLEQEKLEKFSVELSINGEKLGKADEEFIDSLGIPELKNLFKKAESLISLASATEINPTPAAVENNRKPAQIKLSSGKTFTESGYTYESFYNEFLSAFTEEATEQFFKNYDLFLNYDGAMLFEIVSKNEIAGEIHREYEIISKSDTEIEFKRTVFYSNNMKSVSEYNPELRDQYETESTNFRFELTEEGWRAALPELISLK